MRDVSLKSLICMVEVTTGSSCGFCMVCKKDEGFLKNDPEFGLKRKIENLYVIITKLSENKVLLERENKMLRDALRLAKKTLKEQHISNG